MKRRQFIAGLGSAAAWPLAARAQQGDRMRRIGVLMSGDENDPAFTRRVFAFGAGRGGACAFENVEIINGTAASDQETDKRLGKKDERASYAALP
jgi:putative tryptophan/tyrosine transport system substrate-binding protein